jgi:hypothetical protein
VTKKGTSFVDFLTDHCDFNKLPAGTPFALLVMWVVFCYLGFQAFLNQYGSFLALFFRDLVEGHTSSVVAGGMLDNQAPAGAVSGGRMLF